MPHRTIGPNFNYRGPAGTGGGDTASPAEMRSPAPRLADRNRSGPHWATQNPIEWENSERRARFGMSCGPKDGDRSPVRWLFLTRPRREGCLLAPVLLFPPSRQTSRRRVPGTMPDPRSTLRWCAALTLSHRRRAGGKVLPTERACHPGIMESAPEKRLAGGRIRAGPDSVLVRPDLGPAWSECRSPYLQPSPPPRSSLPGPADGSRWSPHARFSGRLDRRVSGCRAGGVGRADSADSGRLNLIRGFSWTGVTLGAEP
jgi:hypothetical protein